jgi:hypothetical protein
MVRPDEGGGSTTTTPPPNTNPNPPPSVPLPPADPNDLFPPPPSSPLAPTDKPGDPTKPVDPFAIQGMTMTGAARLRMMLAGFGGDRSSEAYDRFILGIGDVPDDIEYSAALAGEKQAASHRISVRERTKAGNFSDLPETISNPNQDELLLTIQDMKSEVEGDEKVVADFNKALHAAQSKARKRLEDIKDGKPADPTGPKGPKGPGEKDAPLDPFLQRIEDEKKKLANDPQITGGPVDPSEIVGVDEDGNLQSTKKFVNEYLQNKDIPLTPDQEKAWLKSGSYVYMGKRVVDTPYGPVERPVYKYLDTAADEISTWEMTKEGKARLKHYQHLLGQVENGFLDPQTRELWEKAITETARKNKAGNMITVEAQFDMWANTIYAANHRSGGGGRGGGGGGGGGGSSAPFSGELSPEDQAAQYYFAMMQILGDISGVDS